jgi:dipeptidyl aminopeptidase/acylaminoacyl peptidase
MARRRVSPFGSWKSPISALMASRKVELSEVCIDRENIYWLEMRPDQRGRRTIVAHRNDGGKTEDATSAEFDVGTRVYEYGGGSYTVVGGELFFSNFHDMRIYEQRRDSGPKPVTSNTSRFRYADLTVDKRRNRIFCIREEHRPHHRTAVNTLVTIPLDRRSQGTVIESGNDFYLSPRLSPDGSRLAWVTWNFPNMPWDETELWTAEINGNGQLGRRVKVAGGRDESVLQPEWALDGSLYFVSDRSGWWNIFRFRGGRIEHMRTMNAEFGEPQWRLGLSTYAVGIRCLVCAYIREGIYRLATIDAESKEFDTLDLPFTQISYVRADGDIAAFCASSPSIHTSIVKLKLSTRDWSVVRRSGEASIDSYISSPEKIDFPTSHGLTSHAFYYAPKNKDYSGHKGEKPPLLVKVHGGPTDAAVISFDLQIQFFTSRGFAVLDVNYGGSTGYGRKYRERLNGMWGVIDVEDCTTGAEFICRHGGADRKRLLIRGGSAGGFTTLAALAFKKSYRAGACYYGISDLRAWARDTHKFESRYLDKMIGAYPAQRELYLERSPGRFAEKISAPLVIFQGLDDKVVPPTQSRIVVNAMRKKQLPIKYVEFEEEGHGFHMAEHVRKALEMEIQLYSEALSVRLVDCGEATTANTS